MAAVGGTTRSGGDDDAQQGERSSGHTRPERTRRVRMSAVGGELTDPAFG